MAQPEIIRSKTRPAGPRKVYEFGLEFYRGETPEDHFFKAYPSVDVGSLSYVLSATSHPERAIEGMVRSIRKMLADDDGTPLAYEPKRYVPPKPDQEPVFGEHLDASTLPDSGDEDPDLDDVDLDDEYALFVGPDGEPHEAEYIQKAMEFESGSSLRRFVHLMDRDDQLTLQLDQLQKAYQKMVGRAAGRPTRR